MFIELSQDILLSIALYLHSTSILNLSSTCKSLRNIAVDSNLWETLCIRDFRIHPNSFPRTASGWQNMYKNMKSPIVLTWGVNENGRLRQNDTRSRFNMWEFSSNIMVPTIIDTSQFGQIASISCSGFGMHVLNQRGDVWFWGELDQWTNRTEGYKIPLPEPCTQVTSGRTFGCALGDSGCAYTWFYSAGGEDFGVTVIACSGKNPSNTPRKAINITAGWSHIAVLYQDGSILTCHLNQIESVNEITPFKLALDRPESVVRLTAGCDFTVALTSSGHVILWREIGIPPLSATRQSTALELNLQAETFTHLSACLHRLCLYNANSGHIRHYNTENSSDITSNWMRNNHGLVKLTHGDWHGGALLSNGEVWTWGNGSCALGLGNDDRTDVKEPQQVTNGLEGLFVFDIAFGGWHSAALAFRL